jgi:hypothetical protein
VFSLSWLHPWPWTRKIRLFRMLVASNLSIIFQLGEMLLNHAKNTALVSVTETAVNVGRER